MLKLSQNLMDESKIVARFCTEGDKIETYFQRIFAPNFEGYISLYQMKKQLKNKD